MRGLAKAKHNATLLNLVPDAVSLFEYLLILLGVSISDIHGGGGVNKLANLKMMTWNQL